MSPQEQLPPLLQGFGAVPPLVSDIDLSMDDRFLYFSNWLHGDLRQSAREKALKDFSAGKLHVLVATDVAARGIHVDDIDVVIHYDPPSDHKTYLHRSGRTARAGTTGVAVTLIKWDEEMSVKLLQRRLGLDEHPMVEMFSNDERLKDLEADPAAPAEDLAQEFWPGSAGDGVIAQRPPRTAQRPLHRLSAASGARAGASASPAARTAGRPAVSRWSSTSYSRRPTKNFASRFAGGSSI